MTPAAARIPVAGGGSPFPWSPAIFRAIASPRRAAILRALAERAHTPAELARRLGVSDATVRAHLDRLRAAGLASRREDGRVWAYHELTPAGRALFASGPPRALALAATGGAAVAVGLGLLAAWRARLPEPPPPLSMPSVAPPDPVLPWLLGGGIAVVALGAAIALPAFRAWRALRA